MPDPKPRTESIPTLAYEGRRIVEQRRRLIRAMITLIIVKVLLVVGNIALAVLAAPAAVRVMGIVAQIALTLVFFVILLRLISLPQTRADSGE